MILTTPASGQFVITRRILFGQAHAQNLTILPSAILEKFKGMQNSKMDHVPRATSLSAMVACPKAKT